MIEDCGAECVIPLAPAAVSVDPVSGVATIAFLVVTGLLLLATTIKIVRRRRKVLV